MGSNEAQGVLTIREVRGPEDLEMIRVLFLEYAEALNAKVREKRAGRGTD